MHQKPSKPHRSDALAGAAILTLSALVVKLMGLLYRIPMLDRLGTEGMGYFNTALELYALLCALSTAGLPVAMSVLISDTRHRDMPLTARRLGVRRIFSVALVTFMVVGCVGSVLLALFARPLAALLGNPAAASAMVAIAPTVLLICLSSAMRGYFQGKGNMIPTAISQVVESAGKLAFGLLLASRARARGADLPGVAAAAVLGLTIGTLLSLGYLALHKALEGRRAPAAPARLTADGLLAGENCAIETACSLENTNCAAAACPSRRAVFRALMRTALPVTMGAALLSLCRVADLAIILRRLAALGVDSVRANQLYGAYSTLALPLFHLLPTLATSVSVSSIPALAAALADSQTPQNSDEDHEKHSPRQIATRALGVTIYLAVPAALGLSTLSREVLSLLFPAQPVAVAEAAPLLSLLALSVPAACLVTVTGGMLQAAGHPAAPIRALLISTALRLPLLGLLLGVTAGTAVPLLAVPLTTLLGDTVMAALQLRALACHAPALLPTPRQAVSLFGIPLVASVLSLCVASFGRSLLLARYPHMPAPAVTVLFVLTVVLLYAACLLFLQAVRGRRKSLSAQMGLDKI
ncbi:MAG: oligosaccharide flippase family protein [Clostridia bacterium]|nr:oligosaccharide flippase family protein [Clostridia bacterium]